MDSWSSALLASRDKARSEMLAASASAPAAIKRKAPDAPSPAAVPTTPSQPPQQQAIRRPTVLMSSRVAAAEAQAQAQLSADMYKVLEYLTKMGVEQPQTVEQLEAACELRIRTNPELLQAMKNNPFMTLEGNLWAYKPKHNIRSKEQLLQFIRAQKAKEAVPRKELENTFAGFDQALRELKESGEVIGIMQTKDKEMLFYNDPAVTIKVDPILVDMWSKIEMPNDDRAIVRDLEKNGLTTFRVIEAQEDATKVAEKKAIVYRKRITRKDKVYKAHMIDAGELPAPGSKRPKGGKAKDAGGAAQG